MIIKELYNVNILRVKTPDILSYHLSNQNECHLSRVAALQKLYFSPVESAAANKEGLLLKNMSSYQDLKYLVKELRRCATLKTKINKIQHKVGVKIIQIGVNSNTTSTGHKLQGVS